MGVGFEPSKGVAGGLRTYGYQLSDGVRSAKTFQIGHNNGIIAADPHILQYGTATTRIGVPTLPTAAQDNVDSLLFPGSFGFQSIELYQTTAQTLMPLLHATKGIEIALDQVNNESVEYCPGGNNANNPLGCTVGTDPGVFIRATFEITAATGMDQFGVGFRKQEKFIVPTSFLTTGDPIYTDVALLGFATTVATPNIIKLSTDISNGGSCTVSSTGFGISSGDIVRLEMRVRGGKVSTFINNVPTGGRVSKDGIGTAITAQNTTAPTAYTFASALRLVPFIFLRQDAATTTVFLRNLSCGQLVEDGLDFNQQGAQ